MAYDKMAAKKEMLADLKKSMMSEDDAGMKGHLPKVKKVTVMSDSKEGLKKGLSKAEEILAKRSKEIGMDCDEESMPEEHKEMSAEEIEEKIAHYKKMLESKKS